jgi:hypothetical protein
MFQPPLITHWYEFKAGWPQVGGHHELVAGILKELQHRSYYRADWIAPPIRSDMIFGKDTTSVGGKFSLAHP